MKYIKIVAQEYVQYLNPSLISSIQIGNVAQRTGVRMTLTLRGIEREQTIGIMEADYEAVLQQLKDLGLIE